ncbi:MAG: lipid II flippase MurJ [bacterium]
MKAKLLQFIKNPVTISVLIVTFFQFFSRILGFVRQFFIWDRLSPIQSDLLLSANKIPEFISVFLLMGTIYSSVLPVASRIESKDPNNVKVSKYLNLVTLSLSAVILVFLGLAFAFTRTLLEFFTSKEIWDSATSSGLIEDYILSTRILLVIPLAFAVQGVFGVYLTLKKSFTVFAVAGVVANLGTILGLVLSRGDFVKVSMAMVWGWLVADLLYLWGALRDDFVIPSFSFKSLKADFLEFKTDLKQTWLVFLPRIFLIDGFYASSFLVNPLVTSKGEITAYDIGISIQSAFFILITSLGTVFFPDLSKTLHNVKISRKEFWDKIFKYLRISIGLGFLICIVTVVFSPVILWFFTRIGKGQGTEALIITIAQIASVSLIFKSAKEILSKYFYVKESLWLPVLFSTVGLIVLVISTLISFFVFKINATYAASVGLITYEAAWLILAIYYAARDYTEDMKGKNEIVLYTKDERELTVVE